MDFSTPILSRKWIEFQGNKENFGTNPFTLLTWNTLADGLAQDGGFNVENKRCLDWDFRCPKIFAEINSISADIICLQEVNRIEIFATTFKDYAMIYAPKLDSAALNSNCTPDGCVLLLRRTRFEIIEIFVHYLKNINQSTLSNQNAIFVVVKDLIENKKIIVVTTHLKAKNGKENELLRNAQIDEILTLLEAFKSNYSDDIPVILCGDFNSSPNEPCYFTILESMFDFMSIYNKMDRFKCFSNCQRNLKDSLLLYASEEPLFTTWKFRDDGKEKIATIDYIFLSRSKLLVPYELLELPTKLQIGPSGLPCELYPSDHIALSAKFYWKELEKGVSSSSGSI